MNIVHLLWLRRWEGGRYLLWSRFIFLVKFIVDFAAEGNEETMKR